MRFALITMLILVCIGPAIYFCWSMRSDRDRIRYMTGRAPFDEDNRPLGKVARIQPWGRPYRGHLWPDPRPANAWIDDQFCGQYIDRAERCAMNRRITGALLVLVTASLFGNQLSALWANAPDMNWPALIGFAIAFGFAMLGVFRQEHEAQHWIKVAEAYRARRERQRLEALARARAESNATAVKSSRRTIGGRLRGAWEGFRGLSRP